MNSTRWKAYNRRKAIRKNQASIFGDLLAPKSTKNTAKNPAKNAINTTTATNTTTTTNTTTPQTEQPLPYSFVDIESWVSFGGEKIPEDTIKTEHKTENDDFMENSDETPLIGDDAENDVDYQALILWATTAPLYPNAPITVLEAVVLLYQYAIHSNTPKNHLDSLTKLISVLLPYGHSFPPSFYRLVKVVYLLLVLTNLILVLHYRLPRDQTTILHKVLVPVY